MKHYYPSYYGSFRCIASECPDSCCQGWDIVVDSDTENFYRLVEGEFGERIRKLIVTDEDGDRVFRLRDGRQCPFLREDQLCDIYRNLGEKHLCATCAQFPRLRMEYADFTEHTLALSCPEAARLILHEDNAYETFLHEDAEGCEDYSSDVMNLLLRSRNVLVRFLNSQKPLSIRLRDCLRYSLEIQNQLFVRENTSSEAYHPDTLASLFSRLEYIDEQNREMFIHACHEADFSRQERELTRLALYQLYRLYLSAVSTLDVFSLIARMTASLVIVSNLSRENELSLIKASQLYSKEAEQSYENTELLSGAFSYDPLFYSDHLEKLLV